MHYTLLIKNGRIIDPAGGWDGKGDIGLDGRRVAEVGEELDATDAAQVVDAAGRWIVPGIIDPHMHVSSWIGGAPGLRMMAREGVVTALDMAGPVADIIENVRDHGSGMHIACLDAFTRGEEGGKTGFTDAEIDNRLRHSLDEGAWGVKLLGGHYPLTPDTTRRVIRRAAELGMYTAFHAGTTESGSNLDGFREAVALADGRPIHIAHINSYCRGATGKVLHEVQEALELLEASPNIWSESYLSRFNGTSGKCEEGEILSEVTRRCCIVGGFAGDEKGLGEAIRSGYGRVVVHRGGENVRVTGGEGYAHWREQGTDVTLSFPVNIPQAQITVATKQGEQGGFVVDALSTDGGGIPRNTMVRQGLDLVRFGALTPAEFVCKTSASTARMLGLPRKGRLTPGADGDITLLDPAASRAVMAVAGGNVIMVDGVVVGSGGTVITTEQGRARVEAAGVACDAAEPAEALPQKT